MCDYFLPTVFFKLASQPGNKFLVCIFRDGYREYKHESDEEDGKEEEDTDLANDSDEDYFNEDAREEKIEDDDAEDDEYKNVFEENRELQMASHPVPFPHRRFRWHRCLWMPRHRFRWYRRRWRMPHHGRRPYHSLYHPSSG